MFEYIAISRIKENPNNPRTITDEKFQQLVKSVKSFPRMLELRPLVVDGDFVVLWWNMRLRACREAWLAEVPVIMASDLTEEQKREFIIRDNVAYWVWDWDDLWNNWDEEELTEWGLDIPWLEDENDTIPENEPKSFLVVIECETEEQQEKVYNETEPLYPNVSKKNG
jgi:ParB-like chromosome segregation protein Spo0J